MKNSKVTRLCVMALALLALAACGRRGALEPPPGSQQAREMEQRQQAQPQGTAPLSSSPLARPSRPPRDPVKPREPFILDPLLN